MKRTRTVRALSLACALLMSLMLAACAGSGASTAGDMPAVAPAVGGGALPEQGTTDGDGDAAMVIRTKTLRLEVGSTSEAVDEIRNLTRTHEGTVSNMQIASGDEWVYHYEEAGGDGTALRGWVTVRVPSDSYEEFVAEVAKLGTIRFQSESSDDVTQEHVDMTARLENLRAQEARLREFFEAAKDVKDMLSIEQELNRVRGEIESLDAQVKYLERQAAMSTVSVELVEPRDIVTPSGESWGFVDAITTGIRGAAQVLTVTLTVIIATAPIWALGLVAFFVVRAVIRRRRGVAAAGTSEAESEGSDPPGGGPVG